MSSLLFFFKKILPLEVREGPPGARQIIMLNEECYNTSPSPPKYLIYFIPGYTVRNQCPRDIFSFLYFSFLVGGRFWRGRRSGVFASPLDRPPPSSKWLFFFWIDIKIKSIGIGDFLVLATGRPEYNHWVWGDLSQSCEKKGAAV